MSPRDVKAALARKLVSEFHSEAAAQHAEEKFNRVFRDKQTPEDVPTMERSLPGDSIELSKLLVEVGLAPSIREAKRLIEQGGVSVDGERVTDVKAVLSVGQKKETLLKVGKRRFLRVIYLEKTVST
jgi:tyrosyl-tRNA synthetase